MKLNDKNIKKRKTGRKGNRPAGNVQFRSMKVNGRFRFWWERESTGTGKTRLGRETWDSRGQGCRPVSLAICLAILDAHPSLNPKRFRHVASGARVLSVRSRSPAAERIGRWGTRATRITTSRPSGSRGLFPSPGSGSRLLQSPDKKTRGPPSARNRGTARGTHTRVSIITYISHGDISRSPDYFICCTVVGGGGVRIV